MRESEHLFLKLGAFEAELRDWVAEHVDAVLARKLDEWFKAGLKDWDISRDAPYFGFRIPGERDKYFYVWFDAPIGYMASFLNLCRREGIDFDEFWGADSPHELYHFIGKDIPYFHALFWPAMLSGAGYRKPSGLFVHGHVTVDGEKMSKRRGNFITAGDFAEQARSRLSALLLRREARPDDRRSRSEPRRLRRQGELRSRRQARQHREPLRRLHPQAERRALGRSSCRSPRSTPSSRRAADDLAADFEQREYARAVRKIMALADRANQYIDERKPWILAKQAGRRGRGRRRVHARA